jgi:hypothetical protein
MDHAAIARDRDLPHAVAGPTRSRAVSPRSQSVRLIDLPDATHVRARTGAPVVGKADL